MLASWKIDEISLEPVKVNWFYKKEGEWYGSFNVDEYEYDVSFTREDLKRNIKDFKIVSFKFSRPDQDVPYAFSKDFNKPLVIKNTVINEIKSYILSNKIDIFIIKSYTKESSRTKKYKIFAHSLVREFGFIFENEVKLGQYTYFSLFRNKESFLRKDDIIKQINN